MTKIRRKPAEVRYYPGLSAVVASVAETPLGWLAMAVSDGAAVCVVFGGTSPAQAQHRLEEVLRTLWSPPADLRWTARHPYLEAIEGYLQDANTDLSWIPTGVPYRSQFCLKVYRQLRRTQVGEVVTYQQLAAAAGFPRASRAVGSWMRRNPVPLLIPCHRVIRSDGTLGGFTAGLAAKTLLLQWEKQAAANRRTR